VDYSKKNSSLADFLNVSSSNARALECEHIDNGQMNEDLNNIVDTILPETMCYRQPASALSRHGRRSGAEIEREKMRTVISARPDGKDPLSDKVSAGH